MNQRMTPFEMKRKFARNLMFWMGVVYMFVCVDAMTPYTYQLDDIKFALVFILGPILTITYLILLAMKLVDRPRPLFFVPLMAYMVVMVVSTVVAQPHAHWVRWQTTMMQWAYLGPMLAFMAGCQGENGARRGLYFFAIMLLWSTVFGMLHRLGFANMLLDYYRSIGALDHGEPSYMVKMSLTFAGAKDEMMSIILNREFYGGFIALTLPMAIGAFLLTRHHVWQSIWAVTIGLGGVCLFLTQSKGSWGAAAMGVAFFAFLYLFVSRLEVKYRKQIITIAVACAILVGTLVMLTAGSSAQIKSVPLSFSSRAIIWGGALGIWKEFPILGGAPGSYRIYFPTFRRPDYFLYDISHVTISAHNYFLDLLCDTGILGFLTFMTFLGVIYWKFLRRARKDALKENRIVAISMISGMTGFLLSSLVSPCARWAVGGAFLWSAFGMMLSMLQRPIVTEKSIAEKSAVPTPQVTEKLAARKFRLPSELIYGLAILNAIAWIYSATYGVNFFRASMLNNDGVEEMGDETHPGPVQLAQSKFEEASKALQSQSLSATERSNAEQAAQYYLDAYQKSWNLAVNKFTRATEISPSMVTSLYKLASLLTTGEKMQYGPDNFQKALDVYKKIAQYWPDYSQTPYNFASIYMNLNDIDTSLQYLRRSSDQTIDVGINTHYIQTLMRFSQNSPDQQNKTEQTKVSTERRAEAMRAAKRLFEKWDETLGYKTTAEHNGITSGSSVHYELTRAVRMENDVKEDTLLKVAQIYANVARDVGDKNAFLQGLMRLHQAFPGDEDVTTEIIRVYKEKKDIDDLEYFLKGIVDENPLNLHGRCWLGGAYLESGKLQEAKRETLAIERIDPNNADGQYLLFDVYRAADNKAKAKEAGEKYIRLAGNAEPVKGVKKYLDSLAPNSGSTPSGNSLPESPTQ